jgi:hypothetical protein
MARTFIRQDTQIRNSDVYDDTVAAGATMETAPTEIEADLNAIRSQLKRHTWADAAGNWYDDNQTANAKKRGIAALNVDLDDIEEKRLLFRSQILTDITVGAGNAYVILSVAGSETPSETGAVGAVTTEGAVVAFNATFGTATLDEVAGTTAITPKNLCVVREADSGDPLLSSGRTIYALLQCEANVDGQTFNDVAQRVQLSFVRLNAAGDDLELCPVADIQNQDINYSYVRRVAFDNIPEDAYLSGAFIDDAAGSTVTRQSAYDGQGATPVDVTTNSILDLEGAGLIWNIRDDAEAVLFQVTEGSGGGTSEITIGPDVDLYDNDAVDVDFLSGIQAASGTTQIDIGVNAGRIETNGAADLIIDGTQELLFDDGNRAGSTWAAEVKLTETTAEWDAYETQFGGEVSLFNAIVQAAKTGTRRTKVYANGTANTGSDTDIGGVAGGANLDTQLPDMSAGDFLTDYDLYLNGELLRPGANAAANNDYYPGTSLANGQIRFEFNFKSNDVICVIAYDADDV